MSLQPGRFGRFLDGVQVSLGTFSFLPAESLPGNGPVPGQDDRECRRRGYPSGWFSSDRDPICLGFEVEPIKVVFVPEILGSFRSLIAGGGIFLGEHLRMSFSQTALPGIEILAEFFIVSQPNQRAIIADNACRRSCRRRAGS